MFKSQKQVIDSSNPTIQQHMGLQPTDQSFRLSFTHGLIVGQLSLLLVIILFVKYVILEDTPTVIEKEKKSNRPVTRSRRRWTRRSSHDSKSRGSIEPELLSKLAYDLSSHPPETADWLNVLIAQAIVAYRSLIHGAEAGLDHTKTNKAKKIVEEAMNFGRGESPGIISVDYITVTEVDFGEEFPICTNARVRPADETGRMRVEIDVDYSDHVTLAIETKLVVNFPTSRFAILPISLGLTLNQLSATIMAEIPPVAIPLPVNHDPSAPSPAILLSLDPDFTLSMITTSLIGSRAKLQDIPKVEQLIMSRLRGWMVDNLVWPQVRVLKLPGLGRKGSVEDAADGDGEYVWVEGAATSQAGLRNEVTREADEDDGPAQNFRIPLDPAHQYNLQTPDLQAQGVSLKLNHRRSNSGSSRPNLAARPTISTAPLITPPRIRYPHTTDYSAKIEPPESFGPAAPGALPPSDSSPNLRHIPVSESQNCHPTEWHKHESLKRVGLSSEDRARWARAGGMTGVSMGLGTQVTNTTHNLRERIKESERLRDRLGHVDDER